MTARSRRRACALAALLALTGAPVPTARAAPDPFVGTTGPRPWFSGNTTPAAARPFGMVQLGPDTTASHDARVRSASPSGYDGGDRRLRGFSATHLSGAGCAVLGDAPILPLVGRRPKHPRRATVGIDPTTERAAPGRYRVRTGQGVLARLAATERAGLASFRFPTGRAGTVVVSSSASLGGDARARTRVVDDRTLAVAVDAPGLCGFVTSYRVWLRFEFNRPWRDSGMWGARRAKRTAVGRDSGAWVTFAPRHARRLAVRIGVSFTDAAGARRNLRRDLPHFDVARAERRAAAAWRTELDRVRVTGGSADERRVLGTALYHALLHPTLASDVDRRYRGFDGRVHRVPRGRRLYTAIGGWDVYRTQLPLLGWLRPDVAGDVVESLVRAGREGGWVPRWPFLGRYTGIMNGDSAAPSIAAAVAFGASGVRLDAAVDLLVRQARPSDRAPGQGWFVARPGLEGYLADGYVPADTRERLLDWSVSGSTTLEYAVDDFALARLAERAGRSAVAAELHARSASWRNLYNPAENMLTARTADGSPQPCCDGFQEGSAAQYTWFVPHDMAGLVDLLGGPAEVLDRVQDFHTELNTGGTRRAWLGNQHGFATPWVPHWLGRPDVSSDLVARARAELWTTGSGGLPGNDDLGSLSAWYVWASLGLYPLIPGTAVLGITAPAFDRIEVRPLGRTPTVISRSGAGDHVFGVEVDGTPTSHSWLDVASGYPAEITVLTTDAPAPAWGTGAGDLPPSYPAG